MVIAVNYLYNVWFKHKVQIGDNLCTLQILQYTISITTIIKFINIVFFMTGHLL